MARTLTSTLEVLCRALASDDAFLMLVEIPRASGSGVFRLARSIEHQTFGGKVFQAASVAIEAPTEEGGPGGRGVSYGRLAIGVPNVSRLPLILVETEDELLGQIATIYLTSEAQLAAGPAASVSWRHKITSVDADEKVLRADCGHPSEQLKAPGPVFDRTTFAGLSPGDPVRLPVQ